MDEAAAIRLDVWLWAARFYKTRQLAKQAIVGGKIVCNDAQVKASRAVRIGDRLQVLRAQECLRIQVLSVSARRGPAIEAQRLYSESAEDRAVREAAQAQRRMEHAGMQPPDGKPDKRARRLIRALGDIDAF